MRPTASHKFLLIVLIALAGLSLWFTYPTWSKRFNRPSFNQPLVPPLMEKVLALPGPNDHPRPTDSISTTPLGSRLLKPGDDRLPDQFSLKVPFTPQAPFANWDATHEQTCEEAAVLMAVYAQLNKPLTPTIAEDELLKLVAWQSQVFGFFEDTTAEQTAKLVSDYYGRRVKVRYDFTVNDIKRALVDQKIPVILFAGRELGNPFYKQPGPIYHAMVIRGYDKNSFYTNDPGTKRGENYHYPQSVIMAASHEWTGDPETILDGRRAMVLVE